MTCFQNPRRNIGQAPVPRRAMIMVLVLFFIVLTTALSVMVMGVATQLIRTTRAEHEEILLRQMTESGYEWFKSREAEDDLDLTTISAEDILPDGTSGTVSISIDALESGVVVIVSRAVFGDRVVMRESRFPAERQAGNRLPSTNPGP